MVGASEEMSRSRNSRNQWQGPWPRVLCVCSAGLLRSPTLAWVLSNPPYNCNTRAAGSHKEYALVPVDKVLLEWAQIVVFVSGQNRTRVAEEGFQIAGVTYVLNVPDCYSFRSPELVKAIEKELVSVGFPHYEL